MTPADIMKRRRELIEQLRRLDELESTDAAGACFDKGLQHMTNTQLVESVRMDHDWLCRKVKSVGPGAYADSGEARICAELREMSRRLA